MTEQVDWRPATIGGEPWPYEVSSHGAVRRATRAGGTRPGHPIRAVVGTCRYPHVTLHAGGRRRTVTVHRLVAEAFLGPAPVGAEVNHRDGDKMNASVRNLEYVTRSENMRHAFATGLNKPHGFNGARNGAAKLSERQARSLYRRAHAGENQRRLAAEYGVSPALVTMVKQGQVWGHVTQERS
jgi:hypothetical protein